MTTKKRFHKWTLFASWGTIFLGIVLALLLYSSSEDVPFLYLCASFTFVLTIYILFKLREHFSANREVFLQFIILQILYTVCNIFLPLMELEMSSNLEGLWIFLLILYEIIISLKLILTYRNTTFLGVIFLITSILGTVFTILSIENNDLYFVALIVLSSIPFYGALIYYLREAPEEAEKKIATLKEPQGRIKKWAKIIGYIFLSAFIVLITIQTFRTAKQISEDDMYPKIVVKWKSWVAQKVLDKNTKEAIIDSFVTKQIDSKNIRIEYLGDYSDDESGDAQYAEFLVNELLTKLVLAHIDCSGKIQEEIQQSIRKVISSSYYFNSEFESAALELLWSKSFIEYSIDQIKSNELHFCNNIMSIIGVSSYKYGGSLSLFSDRVEIFEWEKDYEESGSNHDIYYVIYLVNQRTYVLCTIMERKDGVSEIQINKQSSNYLQLYDY